MILSEESMASLRDVDIRVVSRIDLKRRVMKTLALKLVTARDVVGASRTNVGARVQNMKRPSKSDLVEPTNG